MEARQKVWLGRSRSGWAATAALTKLAFSWKGQRLSCRFTWATPLTFAVSACPSTTRCTRSARDEGLCVGSFDLRQEACEEADRRQERADLIDELDAGAIGEQAENGGTESGHPEREAEEHPGDRTDLARQQLLRVHHDRRERRGEDQADHHRERAGPEQVGVRQQQRERQRAQDRKPDDVLAAEAVTKRTADDRPHGYRGDEHEQVELRDLHRHAELVDQIERQIVGQANEVEVLRED